MVLEDCHTSALLKTLSSVLVLIPWGKDFVWFCLTVLFVKYSFPLCKNKKTQTKAYSTVYIVPNKKD